MKAMGYNKMKEMKAIRVWQIAKVFRAYFASNASANTPAASGAAADVPECVVVHFPYKSVVA